jgi:tRNA-specific 2-thiouridylase
VKLRSLLLLAEARGIDFVATGHYARIVEHGGGHALCRANDARKDQTYFLYRLQRPWLTRLRFPVGSLQKAEVWERAEALGLPAEELKESQEICFVSQGDYRTFLTTEAPESQQPGDFVDLDGRILGRHDGIAFYTPGQRRGLGVAAGTRLYVHHVEPSSRTVVLGPEESLLSERCTIADLNVFDDRLRVEPMDAFVKIRYATAPAAASVQPTGAGTLEIHFATPQRALTPGQSAVLYDGDRVLGGGIIQ